MRGNDGTTAETVRRRRVITVALAAAALVTVCPTASAQQAESSTGNPWYVSVSKWAKWGALVSAAGFTTLAVVRNDDANEIFAGLNEFCRNASQACVLGADGRYINADAETLYQETLRLDGTARTWMILGQVSLVAAGGMFLIDLVVGGDEPENIPFSPFEVVMEPRRIGLRWRF